MNNKNDKKNKYTVIMTNLYLSEQFGRGAKKWTTLKHNGVFFPPEYVQHFTPVLYNGKEVYLEKAAEEIASMYAKYINTDYVLNKTFRNNFWSEWKKTLRGTIIENLELCDFSLIADKIKELKDNDKNGEKENVDKYKIAYVDGKEQPVGNFRIEPPGIFLGRGNNPKLGKIKMRIYPEDIIINIGKDEEIPKPLNNHKWKKVVHDRESEWLASWRDNITGKMKYVWLGAHSELKGKGDQQKFNLARKLKKKIKKIMDDNYINLSSDNMKVKQTATALYLIAKLALRVGNEKGEDETDTVGITSLRYEHLLLGDKNKITFDFLGKDSVRYFNTVEVENVIYDNLSEFLSGKAKYDDVFDKITAADINKYLQSFMKGLTAKVFRTYNASNLFQKELRKISLKYDTYNKDDKVILLLNEYNSANAKVAQLCNHQKNICKSFKDVVEKIDTQIKDVKKKLAKAKKGKKKQTVIDKLKNKLVTLKTKKNLKIELKNVSLGTSKVNYIDPRITIAFMKTHNLNVDKVFTKTLQDKFAWAFTVDKDFKF